MLSRVFKFEQESNDLERALGCAMDFHPIGFSEVIQVGFEPIDLLVHSDDYEACLKNIRNIICKGNGIFNEQAFFQLFGNIALPFLEKARLACMNSHFDDLNRIIMRLLSSTYLAGALTGKNGPSAELGLTCPPLYNHVVRVNKPKFGPRPVNIHFVNEVQREVSYEDAQGLHVYVTLSNLGKYNVFLPVFSDQLPGFKKCLGKQPMMGGARKKSRRVNKKRSTRRRKY